MGRISEQSAVPPTRTLLSYGGVMVPLAIVDVPIVIYLPVFYSREIGIDIGIVGLIFVLARIWDGITDPLIGWLSDRTRSRFGRRKPWVVLGAPLLMISVWFAFNPTEDVGPVYAGFWMFCLFLSTTAVYIPYLSWGAELSTDYDGRSVVAGYREVASIIGNIAVAAGPVVLLAADAPVREVLFYLLVCVLVLVPLTVLPAVFVKDEPVREEVAPFSFKSAWGLLLENKPFQQLIITAILTGVAIGIINSLAIFLVDDAMGLKGSFFALFLIEYVVAIAFSPFIVKLANSLGKHRIVQLALGMFGFALLLFAFGPRENFLFAAVAISIFGCGQVAVWIMNTSILADIVDFDTVRSGEKRAGLYMSLYKFSAKFSMALGVGVAYGALDLLGYEAKTGSGESGIFAIKLVGLWLPLLLIIPGLYIFSRFLLDRRQYQLIREQLDQVDAVSQAESGIGIPGGN